MKLTGESTVNAPPDRVRAALHDPGVLSRAIPGCQQLEVTGPGACRLTITAAVASTTGTYTGEAKLTSHDPDSLTVTASLAGAHGIVKATIQAKLTEVSDGTNVGYDADAEVTGMIAAVGSRLLTSAATRLATQFLNSLNAELAIPEPPSQRSSEGQAVPPGPQCSPAGAADDPRPGRSPAGAAGVASPTASPTRGDSGSTTEPRSVPRQPAGRLGTAPAPTFATGVLTGAALTLAGVILARRRTRP